MTRLPNPTLGAILNVIWFGLADLYVMHWGIGLAKMIVPFFVPMVITMASFHVSEQVNGNISAGFVAWLLTLLYIGVVARVGYQTVKEVIEEKQKAQ